MKEELASVLLRDLQVLRLEVKAYPAEELLWSCPKGISNSAGTLALHLVGNLQYYVGACLGGTGYVRDRTAEFSDRHVPVAVIEHRIAAAMKAVKDTLERLDDGRLEAPFPEPVGGQILPTRLFLTHLVSHTGYHLGQIDYHRRLVTRTNDPVGLPFAALLEAT